MSKTTVKKEPIIQFMKKENKIPKNLDLKPRDIIVRKPKKTIEYKDGYEIHKTTYDNVNVTKKVNETKKLIQNLTAEQKIQELEKIFTGESKK